MLVNSNSIAINLNFALTKILKFKSSWIKIIISADRKPQAAHRGCYNAPQTDEVAVLIVDQEILK